MNRRVQKFFINNFSSVLFLLIFALAIFLRSGMFVQGDFYLLADQGRDLQLVKQIVVDHKLTLIGGHAGFGGLFHGPMYWYMIVPFFLFSGGDPFWSLVPLYLTISLGIVAAGYFAGKSLYGHFTGLLFALILAISGTFVTSINFTSNSQVIPLIFLIFIYCAIKYLRGSINYLPALFFLTALGINFEAAFAIMLIPIIFLLILAAKKKISKSIILLSAAGFAIPVLSYVIFDLRHEFLMSKSVLKILTGDVAQNAGDVKLNDFIFRLQDRFDYLLKSFNFVLFSENLTARLLSYIVVVFAGVLVVYKKIKYKKFIREDYELFFIFFMPLVIFALYVFIKLPIQGHYISSLAVSIVLLFVLCLRKIASSSRVLSIILLFLFLTFQIGPVIEYITSGYFQGLKYSAISNGSYLNERNIVDYVFEDSKGDPFGYFVFDLPIVTYSMDYLFWWRGTAKYKYVPKSEKLATTYLILNPAKAGDLHAHDFWIKNTIRTKARVVKKKEMPGGVKILKLEVPKDDPAVDPNYYQNFIFR